MDELRTALLQGRGVVVTGAGRGIGRALATRMAAEGARVVVNDLDPATAQAVADEIGGTAVPGDVSSADGVRAVIGSATEALGRIDVFFANAGIDGAGGPDSLQTTDEVWARVMDVNVMAHVRAARELVPRWLEDGLGGRFVVTASAAGLLTMIGSAPYSVTKHAAVGFAEWLSVTYGARGIDVHAICPQGVQTTMLEDAGPLQALLSRDSALRARGRRRRGRHRDRRGPVPGPPPPRGRRLLRRPRHRHRPVAGRHAPAPAEGRRGRSPLMKEATSRRPTSPGSTSTAFRSWYDGQRPGELGGELSARLIAGGKSNLTYEVTDGAGWWIVRRPPLGHVQATAHDMGREYTAMTALRDTDVPVPTTYAHCADPDVLGAPFYVMERVIGTAYRSAEQLEPLGPERTATIAGRMVDVLAALHAVDPAEVGLAEFGRPEGFLERQVRRWGKQLEGSKTREHPDADELHRRLTAGVPAEDPAVVGIVHGDYRLDNLLTGDDDQIKAVVDWEMATLGDTRTDVALLLVYDQIAADLRRRAGGRRRAGRRLPDARAAPGALRRRQRPRARRHGIPSRPSPTSSSP